MECPGDYSTYYIRFWSTDKSILSISLAELAVNRIESYFPLFQEHFCCLSMRLAESTTQTQDDVNVRLISRYLRGIKKARQVGGLDGAIKLDGGAQSRRCKSFSAKVNHMTATEFQQNSFSIL